MLVFMHFERRIVMGETKKLKAIVIGCGNRGDIYTKCMSPDLFEVVAVADPVEAKRNLIKDRWNVPDEMCFESWETLLEKDKFADIALVCTMDRMHREPSVKAMEKGYDLLLEKPVASTPEDCVAILNAAKQYNRKVLVCHVLRYAPFFVKLKELVDGGLIGDVVAIEHDECVGNIHQSHSFVRGNWGNSKKSSSMILQKTCHDMDILQWIIGKKCKSVSSFGSLTYFKKENAPEGAPDYCIEGCPKANECFYNAVDIYYENPDDPMKKCIITQKDDPTDDEIMQALRTTQYGKCVFKCDNDVVDHQVVNLEFEGGATVAFTMCAFNEGGRHIRVMGTKGELVGNMDDSCFDFYSFATKTHETIKSSDKPIGATIVDGHGGGDGEIIKTLYKYVAFGEGNNQLSEIDISVENHLIAFAAEKSRVEHRVIDIEDYKKELNCM